MDLKNYAPKAPFGQKHLLKLAHYTEDEILQILSLALKMKERPCDYRPLTGKTLAMIFTKSSTRTRVSFETGIYQLGGMGLFLSSADIQLGRGETISDTAKVLSRMVDGIMIRTFAQSDVEELAEQGTIPVINGLTDDYHPCQVLADMMTVYEHKGALQGLKLAYIGDGNNMANSLMAVCAKVGMDVYIASPEKYAPCERFVEEARAAAAACHGSKVVVTADAAEAARDSDVIYTDVWASMGQESQFDEKSKHFGPYQVNEALTALAKPDYMFLHCLPAHRGEEVTAGVIDGPNSFVFDEAENRLHAQKAVMALLMGER